MMVKDESYGSQNCFFKQKIVLNGSLFYRSFTA